MLHFESNIRHEQKFKTKMGLKCHRFEIQHTSKFYKLIIYEINDSSAKYVNSRKNLIILRFRLSPSSGMVVRKKYFENNRDKMK